MGDVGHGQRQTLLQGPDLFAHLAAQAGIEVGQGLIKQQHIRLQHQGAGQGHALLLAARQLAGQALVKVNQAHILQGVQRPGTRIRLGHTGHLQAIAHVLDHVHVREQGVALKHHADIALGGAQRGDIFAPHDDPARRGRLQPGNHAQRGGFAAAGRPQNGGERALADFKADAFDGQRRIRVRAVTLGDVVKLNAVVHAVYSLLMAGGHRNRFSPPQLALPHKKLD